MKNLSLITVTLILSACNPQDISTPTAPIAAATPQTPVTAPCDGMDTFFPAIQASQHHQGSTQIWNCTNNCSQVSFMSIGINYINPGINNEQYGFVQGITGSGLNMTGTQNTYTLGDDQNHDVIINGKMNFLVFDSGDPATQYNAKMGCNEFTLNGATFSVGSINENGF